jgi:death on curing protein
MKYLDEQAVLFIHSAVVDETGGSHGIRELGLLRSALALPRQSFEKKDLYPTLFKKATALIMSLIKNHPFIDGNKRTAVVTLGIFLEVNGYTLQVENAALAEFINEMAGTRMSSSKVENWIKSNSKKIR